MAGARQVRRASPVTLAQVADAAGVSLQTVSNVINAPERVRPETRSRVEHTIGQLGYRPNRHARSLRTRQSRTLGLRVEQPTAFGATVLDRFLHALTAAARGHDYLVMLFDPHSDDETEGYAELVRAGVVDAFALTGTHSEDRRPAFLAQLRVPYVSFGRPWRASADDPAHPWVDVDGAAGTAEAVRHLLSRGRRNIAFIGWPEDSDTGQDRLRGWHDTCVALGLTPGPVLRVVDDPMAAADAVTALLDKPLDSSDAFVCASDTLAAGVCRALLQRGLVPGAETAVVGFDDGPTATLLPIPLTSVSQPVEQVASEMVRLLDSLLHGTAVEETAVLLTPSLTVRQSA